MQRRSLNSCRARLKQSFSSSTHGEPPRCQQRDKRDSFTSTTPDAARSYRASARQGVAHTPKFRPILDLTVLSSWFARASALHSFHPAFSVLPESNPNSPSVGVGAARAISCTALLCGFAPLGGKPPGFAVGIVIKFESLRVPQRHRHTRRNPTSSLALCFIKNHERTPLLPNPSKAAMQFSSPSRVEQSKSKPRQSTAIEWAYAAALAADACCFFSSSSSNLESQPISVANFSSCSSFM